MARPGGRPEQYGPHLPVGFEEVPSDDFADPARGERVPRCRSCGMPGGAVYVIGQVRNRDVCIRLCWHCVVTAPGNAWLLDPDPVQLAETAA